MQRELEKIKKNASTIAEHPSLPAAAKERLRNDVEEFVARYNEKMQAMHKRGAEMISTYEELLVSSLTPIHLVSSYKGQAQNP